MAAFATDEPAASAVSAAPAAARPQLGSLLPPAAAAVPLALVPPRPQLYVQLYSSVQLFASAPAPEIVAPVAVAFLSRDTAVPGLCPSPHPEECCSSWFSETPPHPPSSSRILFRRWTTRKTPSMTSPPPPSPPPPPTRPPPPPSPHPHPPHSGGVQEAQAVPAVCDAAWTKGAVTSRPFPRKARRHDARRR